MSSSFCRLILLFISFYPTDGYAVVGLYRCLFNSSELKDIQYIFSIYYNKVEFLQFDSNGGNFSGYTKFGMGLADILNNNNKIIKKWRGLKKLACHHISEIWYRTVLNKSVKPSVTLQSVAPPAGHHAAMLLCTAYDFYPKRIKVTWLRDGQDVTSDVTSTNELTNGNWLYQIHSYLEYTPRFGEKISCMVEHMSLQEPLIIDWEMSESDKNKIAIGASGLVLGLTLSFAGFIYYKRKSRGLIPVPT